MKQDDCNKKYPQSALSKMKCGTKYIDPSRNYAEVTIK